MVDREKYARWIHEVRMRAGESKIQFAGHVCHFRIRDGQRICSRYHRNEAANWETGRNLPLNTEAFLSIALFDYDTTHPERGSDFAARNRRLTHAVQRMRELIGVDLYCRNLHDALLIQVCRGVLTFEEVPEREADLETLIEKAVQEKGLNEQQQRNLALQHETENIRSDLYQVLSCEEMVKVILSNSLFFYTAGRTLGERFQQLYNSRKRYARAIGLGAAVQLYAPNYANSYVRLFRSTGVTREWLVDLCVHLRFEREEINQVLENAHMAPLSENPKDWEYCIRSLATGNINESLAYYGPIGSGQWRAALERRREVPCPLPYSDFLSMDLVSRIAVIFITAVYIRMEDGINVLTLPDCLLESFLKYEKAKEILRKLDLYASRSEAFGEDAEPWEALSRESAFYKWMEYIQGPVYWAQEEQMEDLLALYRQEYGTFYCEGQPRFAHVEGKKELSKLYFLAAISFTVLTGKLYDGNLSNSDLVRIRTQFEGLGEEAMYVYRFFSQVLGVFLGSDPIEEPKRGIFFCRYGESGEKKTRQLNMKSLLDDLWDSLLEIRQREEGKS